MRLTKHQKTAIKKLSVSNGDWSYGTLVNARTLNSLHRRGLVIYAYDPRRAQFCERLTDAGREIAGLSPSNPNQPDLKSVRFDEATEADRRPIPAKF